MPESLSQQRQASVFIPPEFLEVFERAYQIWRDRLVEENREGLPVADATSDRLLQEIGHLSHGLVRSRDH